MFIYLSITKYASHLDLDPYKIMSSKQMSRSMSKSTFTYLFMILKSIIKYASHLDQFKMMSSNVAKWCHIATTVVLYMSQWASNLWRSRPSRRNFLINSWWQLYLYQHGYKNWHSNILHLRFKIYSLKLQHSHLFFDC